MGFDRDNVLWSKDSVYIRFKNTEDMFGKKVLNKKIPPHFKEFKKCLSYLRKRGFKVGMNPYHEEAGKDGGSLSFLHRIGVKGGVTALIKAGGHSIKVQFGDNKNQWGIDGRSHRGLSMWSDPTDERYTPITYLEQKAIDLECLRLTEFFVGLGFPREYDDSKLTMLERVIKEANEDYHVKGEVKVIEDIGKTIKPDSYTYKNNSQDANKKQIICGETKYYYDYKNRLKCGIVIHSSNNRWMVFNNTYTTKDCVSDYELFDYSPELPRRRPNKRKLKSLLSGVTEKMEFEKCIAIRDYAKSKGVEV